MSQGLFRVVTMVDTSMGAPPLPTFPQDTMAAHAEGAVKVFGVGETHVVALDQVTVGFERGRFNAIMATAREAPTRTRATDGCSTENPFVWRQAAAAPHAGPIRKTAGSRQPGRDGARHGGARAGACLRWS